MKVISGYRDLEIWRSAMDLVVDAYRACENLPANEDFGLKTQIKRSAVSVAANIAEGHGRGTTGEYIQHLFVAHGSLMELETHFQIAGRLGFISGGRLKDLLEQTAGIGRRTNALIARLRVRANKKVRNPAATEVEFPDL